MQPLTVQHFSAQILRLTSAASAPKLLVAVSGGVDSMVLLHLIGQLSSDIAVAHVNYGLRGDASDQDELLVQNYCDMHSLTFHLLRVQPDQQPVEGIQEWARDLRYQYFEQLAADKGYDYILTAHHQDDLAETMLHHLSRGTGLKGLCGIPEQRKNIIRPLLPYRRREIERYASANAIPYRLDESNAQNKYTRNRMRQTVVPALQSINPYFVENAAHTAENLRETKKLLEDVSWALLAPYVKSASPAITAWEQLATAERFSLTNDARGIVPTSLLHHILISTGVTDERLRGRILQAETGKFFRTATHEILIDFDAMVFTRKGASTEVGGMGLTLQKIFPTHYRVIIPEHFRPEFNTASWMVAAEKIHLPLRIVPVDTSQKLLLGTHIGNKKISKILKDSKIPYAERALLRNITDADGRILGIVPLRQNAEFAAENYQNAFRIDFDRLKL